MATDPLASLRAKLKAAKPAATSQVNAPSTTKPSASDPLAALRAKIKAGQSTDLQSHSRSFTYARSGALTAAQLGDLYQKVILAQHPHIVALQAIYQAGVTGATPT